MGPTDLPLAELILKEGYITRAQLDEVLAQHALDKRPLITIMLEKGFITNEHLATVLTDMRMMVESVPAKSSPTVARDQVPDEVRIAAANPKNELGKYILIRMLGKGGMGEVYKAWGTGLHRYVAIKFVHINNETDRQRFTREAHNEESIPRSCAIYAKEVEYGTQLKPGDTLRVPANFRDWKHDSEWSVDDKGVLRASVSRTLSFVRTPSPSEFYTISYRQAIKPPSGGTAYITVAFRACERHLALFLLFSSARCQVGLATLGEAGNHLIDSPRAFAAQEVQAGAVDIRVEPSGVSIRVNDKEMIRLTESDVYRVYRTLDDQRIQHEVTLTDLQIQTRK